MTTLTLYALADQLAQTLDQVNEDGELPEGKRKLVTDPEAHLWVYELRKFMRSNAGTCFNQKS